MKGQKGLRENEEVVEEGVEAVKKGMRAKQLREREREDHPPPSVVLVSRHVSDTTDVIEA